ncbi:MAG: M48 family metalloprotease [Deltaproteobacteria bacterium]|nr:M48 family metalloprotease [Deltaproteobacteria bacterium]
MDEPKRLAEHPPSGGPKILAEHNPRAELQAQGDRELAERILSDFAVRQVIERFEKLAKELSARRHLLGTAVRLTPEMAPDIHAIVDGCRVALGFEEPLETYVYPEVQFNAAAVRPERGRFFVILSAGLLEAFEADELRFVVGHELGHHLFQHHRIPVPPLLAELGRNDPGFALRLFAWQRYAEISSDRAGLFCAGRLEPAAHALFKLASGLRGARVKVRIDQFLAQVGDLREESERVAKADEPIRSDWFASHPFSPLRLRAAELFSRSELMVARGTPRQALEEEVEELIGLMDPSYLQEHSEAAEAMRRLLLAGGVLVATANGGIETKAIEALEQLLGAGALPARLSPAALREDLPRRIAAVKELVAPLRRAQVIRDLCLIARADGRVDPAELEVLYTLADATGVDRHIVACTVSGALAEEESARGGVSAAGGALNLDETGEPTE